MGNAFQQVFERFQVLAPRRRRFLVAVAGAPGSGKTTFAAQLSERFNAAGTETCVVPMDGFHLDNTTLREHGSYARKGAHDTFDAIGLLRLIENVSMGNPVDYPLFDRASDGTIPNGGHLPARIQTVIFEGNYLLLDAPVWRNMLPYWDLSVFLDVPKALLRERLIQRWRDHGLSADRAIARAEGNDLRNANLITPSEARADLVIRGL